MNNIINKCKGKSELSLYSHKPVETSLRNSHPFTPENRLQIAQMDTFSYKYLHQVYVEKYVFNQKLSTLVNPAFKLPYGVYPNKMNVKIK